MLGTLDTGEQRLAAARSRAYRVFCAAFTYPDDWFRQVIRDGDLAEALREALGAVDPVLAGAGDWPALADGGHDDDLAVEYTRLFDVGMSGPPCPLHGGLYGGVRMTVMEEAVRFYNHFGLRLDEDERELPDHLQTELEFLHFLSFREAELLVAGQDPGAFRRAQRDFVARHPGRWVPRLQALLAEQEPPRFFRALVALLAAFLAHEQRHLLAVAGPAPAAGTGRTRPAGPQATAVS